APSADGRAPLFLVAVRRTDEREAPRDEKCRADALERTNTDEDCAVWREAASDRSEREENHAGREHASSPESIAERAADEDERRQEERVALDDPLDDGHGRAELALHHRKSDVHDGRVEKCHARTEHRDDERPTSHPRKIPSRTRSEREKDLRPMLEGRYGEESFANALVTGSSEAVGEVGIVEESIECSCHLLAIARI